MPHKLTKSNKGYVLILMPTHKDSGTTQNIFASNGISSRVCASLQEICHEINSGADAAIITEEILLADRTKVLEQTLEKQPPWSDFPLIVLTRAGTDSQASLTALEAIGHMTLIKRPIQLSELLSSAHAAIRDRRRQYAARFLLEERERQAEALRASEEQFRQLANSIPQLAWMTDANGGIFWYNQRWYDFTGATQETSTGWQWQNLIHPDHHERVIVKFREALETGEIWEDTFPIKGANGSYRWFLSRAYRIKNAKGDTLHWFGTNTDVTDQRRLQTELSAARDRAEAANLAKSEFLANMSHEIRTPMNAIIGLSSILSLTKPLTPKQKEFLKTLQLSADSLLALINDLLDIAKIETKNVELEKIPFDFAALIQETVDMMSGQAAEKNISFETEMNVIFGKEFIGDPTRVRQIISNLCSNAIKFTEHGGVRLVASSSSPPDAETAVIEIAVIDTGIGIPPDKREAIFDKFTQADTSVNRKYGGTGLGLAITKTLVELMNGEISVTSKLGHGTTFTITLPLLVGHGHFPAMLADKNEQDLKAQDRPDSRRPRILLVEDYPPNILVAGTYLENFGYNFDVAENGLEAVERNKSCHYAAILMDVQMHEMNGYQATEAIRSHETAIGKKPVTIIGMTAHALQGDRERCLEAGMDDYLSKPFNPDELRKKLETVVRQSELV